MSKVSEKILQEIARYKTINNYIFEQEVPPPPGGDVPPPPEGDVTLPSPDEVTTPAPDATAAAPTTEPQPVDVEADAEVEKIGPEGEEGNEELEITDLVDAQKNIETKQDEYFNNLFSQITNLENKLSEMDKFFDKLNSIETKIEKYREKTPQEKLELRSIDSGPFNQKLTDFFQDKQEDIEKSGKNEYVLTADEVEDYTPSEIKTTFNDYEQDTQTFKPIKF
jgi:hypothetical protein